LLATQTTNSTPGLFTRVASGVLLRSCDSPWLFRVGATAYIGAVGQVGLGGELEAAIAVSPDARFGLHIALESGDDALYSADLRFHCCEERMWMQVGGYHWARPSGGMNGVAGGVGFEGLPGAVLGGLELGIGGTIVLAILSGLSNTH